MISGGDLLSRSTDAVVRLAHIFRGRARLSQSPTAQVLKLNHISNFSRRFFSEMIIVRKSIQHSIIGPKKLKLECLDYDLLFRAL